AKAVAVAVCREALASKEPAVRRAAAVTVGKLDRAGIATELLPPRLEDPDTAVRIAAIQSLGAVKATETGPALVRATHDEAPPFGAITALTQMPDKRALTAYLTGLGSKNATLRQACRQALVAVRDAVTPALEELVKRNEVPPALLPELQIIYASFTPIP